MESDAAVESHQAFPDENQTWCLLGHEPLTDELCKSQPESVISLFPSHLKDSKLSKTDVVRSPFEGNAKFHSQTFNKREGRSL